MDSICNSILENIFGSSIDGIITLLKMLSTTTSENYRLKILLHNRDVVSGNVPMTLINMVKTTMDVKQIRSYDNIISNVWVPVKSKYTTFQHNYTTNTSKCVMSLASIRTSHVNLDNNCHVEVNFYKTTETVIEGTLTNTSYERHIGEIFEFNDRALNNWIINCYGVIESQTVNTKKFKAKLQPYECCKDFYIEFKLKHVTPFVRTDCSSFLNYCITKSLTSSAYRTTS